MPQTRSMQKRQAETKKADTRKKLKAYKEGKEDPKDLAKEREEVKDEIEKEEEKAEEEFEKSEKTKGKSSKATEAPSAKAEHHSKSEKQVEDKKKVSEVLEEGHIYFLYKPKVQEEEAHSLKDVQRLFVLLAPENNADRKACLIAIPKKSLPSTTRHARNFGIVTAVGDDSNPHNLAADLIKEKEYDTETSGERIQEGARIAGEGVYSIVNYHNSSHLAYVLEVPLEMGDVQKAFHIEKEGSFVISVKNPKSSTATSSSSADFPKELLKEFGNRKWTTCNPTTFLNVKNAELILVGAARNIVEELGKPGEALEEERDEDVEEMEKHHASLERQVLDELGVRKSQTSLKPLHGGWK